MEKNTIEEAISGLIKLAEYSDSDYNSADEDKLRTQPLNPKNFNKKMKIILVKIPEFYDKIGTDKIRVYHLLFIASSKNVAKLLGLSSSNVTRIRINLNLGKSKYRKIEPFLNGWSEILQKDSDIISGQIIKKAIDLILDILVNGFNKGKITYNYYIKLFVNLIKKIKNIHPLHHVKFYQELEFLSRAKNSSSEI